VPPCCHFTRRQVLKWAAVAASTSLVPVVDPDLLFAPARAAEQKPIPHNLELVTVTETSAVFTWYTGTAGLAGGSLQPAPGDTELLLGTAHTKLRPVYYKNDHTPFHYVEIDGLEPGQTYFYEARSGGLAALPAYTELGNPVGTSALSTSNLANPLTPLMFRTPLPPPGRFLFALALANDVHMGETVAGLVKTLPVVGGFPPGISQVRGEPPYALVMCEAMVADARSRGAHALVVAGDVSAEATPTELRDAARTLGKFGTYHKDWFVARGNHDRVHSGTDYMGCRGGDHDCFDDQFFGPGKTWFSSNVNGLHITCLDTYDKFGNGGDNGKLSPAQYDWFVNDLAAHKDQPTLVFGHHPLTLESTLVNLEPLIFDLDPAQAQDIQELYAKTPGVFFHHSGHTHRNKRTLSTTATRVTFQEVSATKEYPGGFSLVRFFEGGYAVNFYKTRSDLAREWSERTRQEYVGLDPLYTFGTFGDRNYVVARDMSGLREAK
jgi:hypothetical protein